MGKKYLRQFIIFTIAVALLAVPCASEAALFGKPKAAKAALVVPATRVEVYIAARQTKMEQGFNTTSTLKAIQEVDIIPKVTGRIESIAVTKGKLVNAGDVLAVIDHRDQSAQVASLKAQVAVNQAEVSQAKVQLDDAQREYNRYSRLRKDGYATQQEFDTRSTTLQAQKAAYARAQAYVTQAQANLRAQEVLLTEYTLKAPISGIVMDDYDITVGTFLSPSSIVFRIGQVDKVKAQIDVPEGQMTRVRLGMEAALKCESYAFQQFAGKVTYMSPYVDTSTRTVRLEVTVDNSMVGYKLHAGMFARVFLIESAENNPLVIPSEAVRGDKTVLVVKNDTVHVTKVKTGLTQGNFVTIDDGLEAGDVVVVSGGSKLKDGDAVSVAETEGVAQPETDTKAQ